MSNRCATATTCGFGFPGGAGGRPRRGRTPLFTTWHALRRHIDLCRTSTALCPAGR